MEFGKACEDLSWNHCTSTPHRSETNGIAERAVRRIEEGTSAVLLQSGLDEKWWADSMDCYCYLRNIQDLLSDGKTPCGRRFGVPFYGPVFPLGRWYCINSVLKSCQVFSLDVRCTREESGMETSWSQIWRNWSRWTHLKCMQKDSMQRKC